MTKIAFYEVFILLSSNREEIWMLLYLWVSEVVSAGFSPEAVDNMYDAIGCWEIWLQDVVLFPWQVLISERFDVCLSNKNNERLFPCGPSVLPWYSYQAVLMGQQGEGTARVTLEKVNVRDGLGVRQAPILLEFGWYFDPEWGVQAFIQKNKTKNTHKQTPHLGHAAPELSLSVSNAWSQLWIIKGCPGHHIADLEAILVLQLWLQLLLTHCAWKKSSQQSQRSQAPWITRHVSGLSTLYGPMHWSLVCEGVPRLTHKLSIQVLALQSWLKFREAQLSCAFHSNMCIFNCSSLP